MTIAEIFKKISTHQIEGLMLHDQLADYFDFLNLHGYKRMHEYHYLSESISMRTTHRYYINHYNMLIEEDDVSSPSVLPSTWKLRTRYDVDIGTRKKSVLNAFEKWKTWECDTKELYEKLYSEACELCEIAAALKIKELIADVDQELKYAERMFIELKSVDFDMTYILEKQDELHEKYKNMSKKIGAYIC